MRKTLVFLLVLCTKLTFAQLNENFDDGDFTNNPAWAGTTTSFQVIDGVLISNGPQAASTLYLSTPNSLSADVAWEFLLNLAFDPSTINYPRIYLTSNQQDLSIPDGLQGYYLQLGSSTSAENFSLVRQDGTTLETILSLPDKVRSPLSNVNVRVRVERSAHGRWAIFTDFTGGTNLTYDGGAIDNTYATTSYFGVYCRYSTASRYDMFRFDDFKIESYTDVIAPKLGKATVISATSIQVDFSEAIPDHLILDVNHYSINNGIGRPSQVQLNGISGNSAILTFANPITSGLENELTVTHIADYAGNGIDLSANTASILMPATMNAKDILISEILFNPKAGGVDFVEVYNPTDKILDLKELTISNPAASSTTKRVISTTSVFIRPKTYWVLTVDPAIVEQQYEVKHPSQMVRVESMPAYNNDKGAVAIWKGDDLIDELSYTENMHHALLKEVKGVSLERVSFVKSASELGNLQSAAAAVGFATPTYQNSQQEETSIKNEVTVANKIFSPDNDGFEDLLVIHYQFKESGNLATINIYTDKGILVRRLTRNTAMSRQGAIYWDGLNDSGQLCKVGLYVIKTAIFNVNGSTHQFKQTCVLASKLN